MTSARLGHVCTREFNENTGIFDRLLTLQLPVMHERSVFFVTVRVACRDVVRIQNTSLIEDCFRYIDAQVLKQFNQ